MLQVSLPKWEKDYVNKPSKYNSWLTIKSAVIKFHEMIFIISNKRERVVHYKCPFIIDLINYIIYVWVNPFEYFDNTNVNLLFKILIQTLVSCSKS